MHPQEAAERQLPAVPSSPDRLRRPARPDTTWLDLHVLGIYTLAKLIGFGILMLVAHELRFVHLPASPRFLLWHNALDRWDVYFYRSIATIGYPRAIPMTPSGDTLASTWAFFPLFPFATRCVQWLTRLDFEWAAVVLNLAAGAVAAVLLSRLVQRFADRATTLRTIWFWVLFPTAIVGQLPYAEATYVVVAAGCLLALFTRRRALAAALLVVAGFSRGYTVPLSAAALWTIGEDVFRRSRRQDAPSERGSVARFAWLATAAIVAPFEWAAVAGFVTGRADAYTATQHVWGYSVDPWIALDEWRHVITHFGTEPFPTVPTLALIAIVLVTAVSLTFRWPAMLKVYAAVAAAFLLALAQPMAIGYGSTPRFAFAILTLPLGLAYLCRSRGLAVVVLAASLLLQYWWVLDLWSGRLGVAP